MIAALKSEFRKIFTVRSTYVYFLAAIALDVLVGFYAKGYHAMLSEGKDPTDLAQGSLIAVSVLSTLVSLITILLVTHEYRYNTINYSLISAKSRTQFLVAKIIAISCLSVLFSIFFAVITPLLIVLGWHLRGGGAALGPQHIDVWNIFWRTTFTGWAFAMFALIIAFIVRIQVGAIVLYFLFPGTIESLLGLILKKNQVYLPFSAAGNIVSTTSINLTYFHSFVVALAYVVVGWIIAGILLAKRDAN